MWLLAGLLLLTGLGALAQQIIQSGKPLPGHAGKWITNLTMGDAGPAGGGPAGTGLTELNITSTLNNNLPFCINDAATTGPFHQLCLGAGGTLSYNAYGGAQQRPLNCIVNGVTINNCLAGGTGPGGPVVGTLPMVSTYGADVTGVNDSTTALQGCLNSVGAGNVCNVDPGAKLKIMGNVAIPANTTLKCGFTFNDSEDSAVASFGTLPAIMLDSGHTISAAGQGAMIQNCLIYRNGMTFPAPNSSAYGGLAISDAGNSNFSLRDSVVLGFATCLYITGSRPYVIHDHFDCAGASGTGQSGAAVEVDNANSGDSGTFADLKGQPFGTGNGSCTASLRPGVGLAMYGFNFLTGGLVFQNYAVAQFEFGGTIMVGGTLWSDDLGSTCGYGSSIGVWLPGGELQAATLNINNTQTGLKVDAGLASIASLVVNVIGQDCIYNTNGRIWVGQLATNMYNSASTPNCGRYASELDASATTGFLTIGQAFVNKVNGSSPPYFHSSKSGAAIPDALNIGQVVSDQPFGTNLYGGFYAVSGSDNMRSHIAMTLGTCTGLGTGSCTLPSNSDIVRGQVTLSPTGTAATTGVVNLTFPIPVGTARICMLNYLSTNWAAVGPLATGAIEVTNTTEQFTWSTTSPLVAGQNYGLGYYCTAV